MEEVGQNILTGDKQWLDNVWKSFCNISILKEIVFCRSACLFEFFFTLSEHLGVIQGRFLTFHVLRSTGLLVLSSFCSI